MIALPGDYGLAVDDRPVLLYIGPDSVLTLGVPTTLGSTEISEIRPLAFEDGEPMGVSARAGMSGRKQIAARDWDSDGTWDIVYNSAANTVVVREQDENQRLLGDTLKTSAAFWCRNVETDTRPVFERPRRILWKDGEIIRSETHSCNVEPANLDGDGELDQIKRDGPGFLYGLMRDELSWE